MINMVDGGFMINMVDMVIMINMMIYIRNNVDIVPIITKSEQIKLLYESYDFPSLLHLYIKGI